MESEGANDEGGERVGDHIGPQIHLATRAMDGSGAVIKGAELNKADAVSHRRTGGDVIVCGDDTAGNRQLALSIEAAVGPWLRQQKHKHSAGPLALLHFQQRQPPPQGHTFYETANAKARKSE